MRRLRKKASDERGTTLPFPKACVVERSSSSFVTGAQVAAINTAMSSLVKTLNVFPTERVIVQRERAKGSYETLPYLSAKLAAELPMGALFPLAFGSLVYPLTGARWVNVASKPTHLQIYDRAFCCLAPGRFRVVSQHCLASLSFAGSCTVYEMAE